MGSDSPQGRWLSIVGIGEDGLAGLSPAARAALDAAALIVGGRRHLEMLGATGAETMAWPSPLTDGIAPILARRGQPVAVLASGDPFFHGVGVTLARHVGADEIAAFPAPSSFSLAAARMGWALQDCALVSLHGHPHELIVPHLQPGRRVLALTWDSTTAAKVAQTLTRMGFGPSRVTVLEALGGPRERRRGAIAGHFGFDDIDPLNVLAIEVVAEPDARPLALRGALDDSFFEHDGQLTKREIRAVTLSALAPHAGQVLWDIGLGAGSVAIEWLLAHPANRAVGIEQDPVRAARAAGNAAALGVPNLTIVQGEAPQALAGLPEPDAVFIGGGLGDDGVVETAMAALQRCGRLVVNAVTLESEARLAALYSQHGGAMTRISVERLVPVGGLHGWRPAMPVTQWTWVKP